MNEVQLRELVTQSLDLHGEERWSLRSGTVLYSDLASIRPGPFYLMGINPGGKPQSDPREAIVCNLAAPDGMNCYADQCWRCCRSPYECEHCDGGRLRPDERDPMQRRVCNLFDALQESPKDVLSTNLIFARSAELSKLQGSKAKWRHRCWSVHQELLRAVRPKWIIALSSVKCFPLFAPRRKSAMSRPFRTGISPSPGTCSWPLISATVTATKSSTRIAHPQNDSPQVFTFTIPQH